MRVFMIGFDGENHHQVTLQYTNKYFAKHIFQSKPVLLTRNFYNTPGFVLVLNTFLYYHIHNYFYFLFCIHVDIFSISYFFMNFV